MNKNYGRPRSIATKHTIIKWGIQGEEIDIIINYYQYERKRQQKTFSTFYKTKIWKNRKEIKKEEEGEEKTKVNFTNLKNVL